MQKRNKKILMVFVSLMTFLFLNINLCLANGIFIVNNNLNFNKTVGQTAYGSFTIINQEPFTFSNISVETNNYISFAPITSLESGKNATINFSIITDSSITKSLKIRGFYFSSIGSQNKTWNVDITPYESAPCGFSVVKGDNVIFKNKLTNQVVMRSYTDNSILAIIDANTTYNKLFTSSGSFNYYLSISGFNFPQVCNINILEDNGYVNDPNLDGILNLSILVSYKQTTISADIPARTYTLDFDSSSDGLMTVTNTGSEIAKGITLSGDWFRFSSNNFDLNPGQSKGLIYTVDPLIYNSNDTGKTYYKDLKISGNFESKTYNFTININQAYFNASANSQDAEYLINVFCPLYPHSVLCEQEPRTVYKYITNGSDQIYNVSITAEQWRNLWLYMFSQGDDIKATNNLVKDKYEETATKFSNVTEAINSMNDKIEEDKTARDTSSTGIMIFVGFIGSTLAISLIVSLIVFYKRKNSEGRINKI